MVFEEEDKSSQEENEPVDLVRLYLVEAASTPLLSAKEAQELASRAKVEKEARDLLIKTHLLLVVSIARSYSPSVRLSLLDLRVTQFYGGPELSG